MSGQFDGVGASDSGVDISKSDVETTNIAEDGDVESAENVEEGEGGEKVEGAVSEEEQPDVLRDQLASVEREITEIRAGVDEHREEIISAYSDLEMYVDASNIPGLRDSLRTLSALESTSDGLKYEISKLESSLADKTVLDSEDLDA